MSTEPSVLGRFLCLDSVTHANLAQTRQVDAAISSPTVCHLLNVWPRVLATDSHWDSAALISGWLWFIYHHGYAVHDISYIIKYPTVTLLVLAMLVVMAALLVVAAAYFLTRRWL